MMRIYRVFFLNSAGVKREIGRGRTIKEAKKRIARFLDEKKYKSYYWRFWEEDGYIWVDVGSWSEFFLMKGELI